MGREGSTGVGRTCRPRPRPRRRVVGCGEERRLPPSPLPALAPAPAPAPASAPASAPACPSRWWWLRPAGADPKYMPTRGDRAAAPADAVFAGGDTHPPACICICTCICVCACVCACNCNCNCVCVCVSEGACNAAGLEVFAMSVSQSLPRPLPSPLPLPPSPFSSPRTCAARFGCTFSASGAAASCRGRRGAGTGTGTGTDTDAGAGTDALHKAVRPPCRCAPCSRRCRSCIKSRWAYCGGVFTRGWVKDRSADRGASRSGRGWRVCGDALPRFLHVDLPPPPLVAVVALVAVVCSS